jgi:hypothetical protein
MIKMLKRKFLHRSLADRVRGIFAGDAWGKSGRFLVIPGKRRPDFMDHPPVF